jgi:tetratricopeptide (TPR) repeat protein
MGAPLELWELVPNPDRPAGLDRVDLLARTADAAAFTGAVQRAVELLQGALAQVDPAVEPVRAAALLARLSGHHRGAGDEAGALAAVERAERLLIGTPPSAERARVLAAHAYALSLSLRLQEAILRGEEAIASARAVGARAEEAKALHVLAGDLAALGQPDRATTLALEARAIAEDVGDAETVIDTYLTVTYVLTLAGRQRDALEEAQRGYQRARHLSLERAPGSFLANQLAFGLLRTGHWAECEQLTRELLTGDRWGAFHLHNAVGTLLTRRGEFSAAREQLQLGLQLSPPFQEDLAWLGLAELALWEGRRDEAAVAVAEGLRFCAARDPEGILPDVSSPGTRWRCGWRPTGPNGRQPDGRSRRSPRPNGGPPQSWPPWTASPPRGRRRPAPRWSPSACCSPGRSSPGWKGGPTPIGGRRRWPPGSSWSIPSTPPTPASGRPRR